MGLRRALGIAAASLLAGCGPISGAANLEVGVLPDGASVLPQSDASADSHNDTGADETTSGDGGVPGTRLREVTFETGFSSRKTARTSCSAAPRSRA